MKRTLGILVLLGSLLHCPLEWAILLLVGKGAGLEWGPLAMVVSAVLGLAGTVAWARARLSAKVKEEERREERRLAAEWNRAINDHNGGQGDPPTLGKGWRKGLKGAWPRKETPA